jgi:hypothetical protein
MTRPKERLIGAIPGLDTTYSSCDYVIDVTCFTEVRLSQAELALTAIRFARHWGGTQIRTGPKRGPGSLCSKLAPRDGCR